MGYRLTRKAEEDIIHIYLEGLRLFGRDQAIAYHGELENTFELIADNPAMARERVEIDPPVRIHPHQSHLIVYLVQDDNEVLIVRIRHGHEDWDSAPVE